MATTSRRSFARNKELGLIHTAKKQLGLDDDTYRTMLFTVARVMSAAELDEHGRKRVIEHLRSRGFRGGRNQGAPHNLKQRPLMRKLGALLADGKKPWSYADAMAQHMFKKPRCAFLDDTELHKLVSAMVIDARRKKERNTYER